MDTANGLTIDQILSVRPVVGAETPQWSSDGAHVAFVGSFGGPANLWSVPSKGGFPVRLTVNMGEVNFLATRAPMWAPTGDYLSYVSRKSGTDEIWLRPANGDAEIQLSRLGGLIHSAAWAPDGGCVAVASSRYGSYDVYTVDVPSGKAKRLTDGPLYAVNPTFTPDGRRIVYVRLNDTWEDHEVVVMDRDGGNPRVIASDTDLFDYTYGKIFGAPHVSPDGSTVVFRSQRSGFLNIWTAPIDDNGEPEPLAPEEADQDNAVWSPTARQVAFTTNRNGTLELRVAEAGSGESRALFAPGVGMCSNLAWSPDGAEIGFRYGTPTTPADLWVVSVKDGSTRRLTDACGQGSPAERFIAPEKIVYRSFDGLQIHAYLYSPPDRSQQYPGVLYIHGGPTHQFFDEVQPNVQYLVRRGYVVLLPNVRGSAGYGKAFEELNDRDWGGGDLQDAIAGAEYLKGLGYVDRENVGITGRSYGGILSMCAVAFAPGVFQAAVPMSGYGDWIALRPEMELRHAKMQAHEFGAYEEYPDVWRDLSPIFKLDQATTPTFVVSGEGRDPTSDASRAFAFEMKRLYKTVKHKVYHNDGYYVDAPANVRQMLMDVADFFDLYLKGEGTGPTGPFDPLTAPIAPRTNA